MLDDIQLRSAAFVALGWVQWQNGWGNEAVGGSRATRSCNRILRFLAFFIIPISQPAETRSPVTNGREIHCSFRKRPWKGESLHTVRLQHDEVVKRVSAPFSCYRAAERTDGRLHSRWSYSKPTVVLNYGLFCPKLRVKDCRMFDCNAYSKYFVGVLHFLLENHIRLTC